MIEFGKMQLWKLEIIKFGRDQNTRTGTLAENGRVGLTCKRGCVRRTLRYLPKQSVPFPSKPELQLQSKPPSMFVQVAWVAQLSSPSSHSSISVSKSIIIIRHRMQSNIINTNVYTHLNMTCHLRCSHLCKCIHSFHLCLYSLPSDHSC